MAAPSKPEAQPTTSPDTAKRAGRGRNLALTYAPSNDRALRSIAAELRRIADALGARQSEPATDAADSEEPAATVAAEEAPALPPQDEALFQSLREWRAGEARKLGMPPYIVATDKALRAVAQRRPRRVEDLQEVPGFGPAKAAKYGPALVEVVAAA